MKIILEEKETEISIKKLNLKGYIVFYAMKGGSICILLHTYENHKSSFGFKMLTSLFNDHLNQKAATSKGAITLAITQGYDVFIQSQDEFRNIYK